MDDVVLTGDFVSESMKFVLYVHTNLRHILYKYGWNHSLDNKVMNLYMTVYQRVWIKSQILLQHFQRKVVQRGVVKSYI